MKLLIAVIIIVLGLQILIFVMTRKKIKRERANNVLEKYNIKYSGDAWRILSDPDIPEEDRIKIERIYNGESKD